MNVVPVKGRGLCGSYLVNFIVDLEDLKIASLQLSAEGIKISRRSLNAKLRANFRAHGMHYQTKVLAALEENYGSADIAAWEKENLPQIESCYPEFFVPYNKEACVSHESKAK